MRITKTIEQEVDVEVDVDVDPEDVLEEMDIDEIEEYLEKRRKENLQYNWKQGDEDYYIMMACKGHVPRNVVPTNKDVKEAINSLIDLFFPS